MVDYNIYVAKTCIQHTCKNLKKVIFSGDALLIPDENAIDKVNKSIEGVDLIVGIGSGVIQDICKYVAFF